MDAKQLVQQLKGRADLNSDGKVDKQDIDAAVDWLEGMATEETTKAPLGSLVAAFAVGAILCAVVLKTFGC